MSRGSPHVSTGPGHSRALLTTCISWAIVDVPLSGLPRHTCGLLLEMGGFGSLPTSLWDWHSPPCGSQGGLGVQLASGSPWGTGTPKGQGRELGALGPQDYREGASISQRACRPFHGGSCPARRSPWGCPQLIGSSPGSCLRPSYMGEWGRLSPGWGLWAWIGSEHAHICSVSAVAGLCHKHAGVSALQDSPVVWNGTSHLPAFIFMVSAWAVCCWHQVWRDQGSARPTGPCPRCQSS